MMRWSRTDLGAIPRFLKFRLMDQSYEVFYQLLRSLASEYLKRLEPPPVDLSVPTPLHEAMSKLSVIMSIYEGSKEEGTSSSSQHSFERVLDLVVDPMLEVIDQMARLRAAEWDRSIFWLNCLEFMLVSHGLRPKRLIISNISHIVPSRSPDRLSWTLAPQIRP